MRTGGILAAAAAIFVSFANGDQFMDMTTPANQCVAGGDVCPDFGGSFWECCTWACDADNKFCRECGMADEKCS